MDFNSNSIMVSFSPMPHFSNEERPILKGPVKKRGADAAVLFLPALEPVLNPPSKPLRSRGSFNQQTSSLLASRPKTPAAKKQNKILLSRLTERSQLRQQSSLDRESDISLDLENKFSLSPYSLQIERIHSGQQPQIRKGSRMLAPLERLIVPDEASIEPNSGVEFHRPIVADKSESLKYSLKLKFLIQKIHKFVEEWDFLYSLNEHSDSNDESIEEKTEFLKILVKQLIKSMPSIESHLMEMRLKIEGS